jgi:Domain of unknown function (DUF5658)
VLAVDLNPEMPGPGCADERGDDTGARRMQTDRRLQPTSPADALRLRGRRVWPRREQERSGAYFVDRFDALTLAVIVTLLALTIADGVLTIELLDTNSEEMNPIMARLILQGHQTFLVGKYVLTAAGLPFIVVYKNYRMFGTRFRIGYVLPIFVGLYIALISYQSRLLRIGREVTSPPGDMSAPHRLRKRPFDKATSQPMAMAQGTNAPVIDGACYFD